MALDSDLPFMTAAIEVARLSRQEAGPPRPKVAAILVMDGKELGKAFRGETGSGDHAEYGLLEKKLAHDNVAGATLYTTLEPCTERNPPKLHCAARIHTRRLGRVVIGMLDPNQRICGQGIRELRSYGIDVDLFPSKLMAQVEDQNREFILHQESITASTVPSGVPAINPKIQTDLVRMDGIWKFESIASAETIFIIAGDTIVSEVLDRCTCGLLRDEIDRIGQGSPFKRALIMSAQSWKNESWFTQKCAAISIGGARANAVSKELLQIAIDKGVKPFPLATGEGVYLSELRPRAVLFGPLAADTRAAVQKYIAEARGLKEFLRNCWG
jgi:pyrimidine deaminase RibD-like protein